MALITRFNLKSSSRCLRSLYLRTLDRFFQQQIFGSLEDVFVGLGGFVVFGVSHLVDDPVELGHDMKQVEENFDMRDALLDRQDIGIPHIHHNGF